VSVAGSLPLVRDDNRVIDVDRTVEAVPRLAAAGVTDFRIAMRPPPDRPAAALDQLSALAAAFREVLPERPSGHHLRPKGSVI
jgi:hypothetical protein